MTAKTPEARQRLAQAIYIFHLQPSEYRAMTLGEWRALIEEYNRSQN